MEGEQDIFYNFLKNLQNLMENKVFKFLGVDFKGIEKKFEQKILAKEKEEKEKKEKKQILVASQKNKLELHAKMKTILKDFKIF